MSYACWAKFWLALGAFTTSSKRKLRWALMAGLQGLKTREFKYEVNSSAQRTVDPGTSSVLQIKASTEEEC
jgi:hypothetical protein